MYRILTAERGMYSFSLTDGTKGHSLCGLNSRLMLLQLGKLAVQAQLAGSHLLLDSHRVWGFSVSVCWWTDAQMVVKGQPWVLVSSAIIFFLLFETESLTGLNHQAAYSTGH